MSIKDMILILHNPYIESRHPDSRGRPVNLGRQKATWYSISRSENRNGSQSSVQSGKKQSLSLWQRKEIQTMLSGEAISERRSPKSGRNMVATGNPACDATDGLRHLGARWRAGWRTHSGLGSGARSLSRCSLIAIKYFLDCAPLASHRKGQHEEDPGSSGRKITSHDGSVAAT